MDAMASAAQHHRKDAGIEVRTPVQSPQSEVLGCVTLGQSLHSSEAPFLLLQLWGSVLDLHCLCCLIS